MNKSQTEQYKEDRPEVYALLSWMVGVNSNFEGMLDALTGDEITSYFKDGTITIKADLKESSALLGKAIDHFRVAIAKAECDIEISKLAEDELRADQLVNQAD